MRLKRNRLVTAYLRKAIPQKDKEGSSYVEYGFPVFFQAETWSAGGKIQSEMYGTRLPNIRNLRLEDRYQEVKKAQGEVVYVTDNGTMFTVHDGICLFSGEHGEPDYKIIAIYPYRFLTMEIERI